MNMLASKFPVTFLKLIGLIYISVKDSIITFHTFLVLEWECALKHLLFLKTLIHVNVNMARQNIDWVADLHTYLLLHRIPCTL